jgi:hypothetical protein
MVSMSRWFAGLTLALAVGCAAEPDFVSLPSLEGFATAVVDDHTSTLRVVALPQGLATLRLDVPAEPGGSGFADLWLYTTPADELALPEVGGQLLRAAPGEPETQALPPPSRVLRLDPERRWGEVSAAEVGELRVRSRECLQLAVDTLVGMGRGDSWFVERRRDDEVVLVVRTGTAPRIYTVTPRELRLVGELPFVGSDWHGRVDAAGRVWLIHTATGTRDRAAFVLTQLDDSLLHAARRFRVELPVAEAQVAWRFDVAERAGRLALGVASTSLGSIAEPSVWTWNEGEVMATRLPWPTARDPVLPCVRTGLLRTYVRLDPSGDGLAFVHAQGVLHRWAGGALTRQVLDTNACGAALLDDREDGGWAVTDPNTGPPPDADLVRRVYQRLEGTWGEVASVPSINGVSLTAWRGRMWTGMSGGGVQELIVRPDGTLRQCPRQDLDPANDRIERLVSVGDTMLAAGPEREGNPWKLYWLRPR